MKVLAQASIAAWSLRTCFTAILASIESNLLLSLHAGTIHLSRTNHDGMGLEANRQPWPAYLVGAFFRVVEGDFGTRDMAVWLAA